MGAYYFDTASVGKTADEAFRLAQERARWENGHGGYTGTIAEKHDYALFTLPARMTAKRFITLVNQAEDHDGLHHMVDHVDWLRRSGAPKTAIRKAETELRKAERARDRFWAKVPEHARDTVRRAASVANGDKWGPAAAIELRGAEATAARKWIGGRGKAYRFFGYASS